MDTSGKTIISLSQGRRRGRPFGAEQSAPPESMIPPTPRCSNAKIRAGLGWARHSWLAFSSHGDLLPQPRPVIHVSLMHRLRRLSTISCCNKFRNNHLRQLQPPDYCILTADFFARLKRRPACRRLTSWLAADPGLKVTLSKPSRTDDLI
jgi:hypothetical protein